MGETATGYEAEARARKAARLAEVLRLCHVSAADAALLDQPERDQLARQIGCRPPSETTWTMVLGVLVRLEADVPADPFAGLPR